VKGQPRDLNKIWKELIWDQILEEDRIVEEEEVEEPVAPSMLSSMIWGQPTPQPKAKDASSKDLKKEKVQ